MTNTNNLQLIAATRHLAATGQARRIRTDANIRASELARHLGVTQTTLNRWETCLRIPSDEDTLRWGRALQELLEITGDFDDLP